MRNSIKLAFTIFTVLFLFPGCTDNDDNLLPNEIRVYDFIWKGMNSYYYWQQDVADLSDSSFGSQDDLNNFYRTYSDPTVFFNHLRIDQGPIDRFSVIFSDYRDLQNVLQGTSKSNGVVYGLKYKTGSTNELFGWVKYILPNTDASTKNIHRGTIFYAVDGISLTISNYKQLLANDNYTLNLADYDSGNITPNSQSVSLQKNEYSVNPVYITKIIPIDASHKAGYLMYNGFYSGYETQLNNTFAVLSNAGVTDLILDLRYNSGGSINTATRLASMITGQFNGQIFAKQQWNAKQQSQIDPNNLLNLFSNTLDDGVALNSLSMTKVFVITSASTASASELVINCLKPYIQVIQIGDVTIGKNVGSVTLYDSPDFSFNHINPNHRYAMQPIVLKTLNKENFGDYETGLVPNHTLLEDIGNLYILGNLNEPLLNLAISRVQIGNKMSVPNNNFKKFEDVSSINDFETDMYLENVPNGILKTLK